MLKYTLINNNDFIRDVIKGKREFSGMKLKDCNLCNCKDYDKVISTLKESQDEPLIISYSDFSNVDARGLYLFNADARESDFHDANLANACFEGANLQKTNFYYTKLVNSNFIGSDLTEACLVNANLYKARLMGANLSRADLERTNLAESNIRSIKNLEEALNLDRIPPDNFRGILVTSAEKDILLRRLTKRLFVVED